MKRSCAALSVETTSMFNSSADSGHSGQLLTGFFTPAQYQLFSPLGDVVAGRSHGCVSVHCTPTCGSDWLSFGVHNQNWLADTEPI